MGSEKKSRVAKGRVAWLDTLRGLTVISMVLYHFMWDVVYAYGGNFPWFKGSVAYLWQQSICWSFIIISGFSFGLGVKPVRRGLVVFLCGVGVTIVTLRFMPEFVIWFGILTLLGSCMIVLGILKEVLIKVPFVIGLIFSGTLFFLFRNVNTGYLGFERFNFVKLPDFLYSDMLSAFFGFPPENFFSTDYFSLIPWVFLFLFGFYLQRAYVSLLYDSGERRTGIPILSEIGRDSLFIYVFHQPVIYGLLYLLANNGVIRI